MALRRRQAVRVVGPGRQPAVPQAVCPQEVLQQQRARPRAACHPDVREAVSSRHQELGLRRERAIQQPEEQRRDVQAAERQACCRAPLVWRSGQQVSPGELREPQASERALPSGLVPSGEVAPQGPLQEARLRAAEASAWWRDVLVPRVAASARAAAGPRPEAASVPWAQQVMAEAAEVPDESEPAAAVASDVPARQPAGARRADAAVLPSAAVRSGGREPQAAAEAALPGARPAAVPLALPSEAVSVFRQGPSLAGPARPRAARFAHVMRSLRIASRSEPSWRAARNEDWSW